MWLLREWFVLLTWVHFYMVKQCTYMHCRNAIHKQIYTSTDLTIHGLLKRVLIGRGAIILYKALWSDRPTVLMSADMQEEYCKESTKDFLGEWI